MQAAILVQDTRAEQRAQWLRQERRQLRNLHRDGIPTMTITDITCESISATLKTSTRCPHKRVVGLEAFRWTRWALLRAGEGRGDLWWQQQAVHHDDNGKQIRFVVHVLQCERVPRSSGGGLRQETQPRYMRVPTEPIRAVCVPTNTTQVQRTYHVTMTSMRHIRYLGSVNGMARHSVEPGRGAFFIQPAVPKSAIT